MNPSRIFILRPVATSLLMFALFLLGIGALRLLPISALPQVDYPTIQITTLYPGASPEVVSAIITSPLEKQFGQLSGLAQMSSTSAGGASTITLQFQLDLSLDVAEQQVQQAINAASGLLPNDLPQPPIYNKINPADAPIITLAISSDLTPLPQVQEIIDNRLLPRLSQVLGVGRVNIGGGKKPAVRISVDMNKLSSFNLSLDDLRNAINNANVSMAKGSFDGKSRAITIDANDQLKSISDYQNLIISWRNSSAIRLGDLASINHAAENEHLAAWANNKEAIILNVQRQPGANVIATVERIKSLIPQISESLPQDINISVLTDRTVAIKAAVNDVRFELALSVALVILVVFIFIRRLWVTVIPSIALPLSLVATFALMYLFGFSINNLSLMALTIATGFVIDDAIVMIDNIARHVEEGEDPLNAALTGSKQIGFTIISLTVSLVAVLIPLLFMADVVGRLFREFAITLAVAIIISAIVSLTLTPMMCAKLLKAKDTKAESKYGQYVANFFEKLINRYKIALTWVLQHQTFTLLVAISSLILTIILYLYIPKGFFPLQDSGIIQAVSEVRQSASFAYIHKQQQKLIERLLADPAVASISANVGVDASNSTLNTGRLLINLKAKGERDNINNVMQRLQNLAEELPGIKFYSLPVQDLTIEGKTSKTQYQLSLSAADWNSLSEWSIKLQEKLNSLTSISGVASDYQEFGRQAYIEVNREQAGRLGISIANLDQTLYSAFGQRLISTIFNQTNLYRVVLEAQPQFKKGIDNLNSIYLINNNGQRIALSAIATIKERNLPLTIERLDQFPSVTLSFNVKENYSLSSAVAEIQDAAEILPTNIELNFQGAAKAFQASLSSTLWLILAAIITVYIVLGVLYESLIHPLTILSTLPTAALGALLALVISRQDLNIVAIIGIILLIGIVKKNAIIMIDFALEMQRDNNLSAEEAIFSACIVRFRPILMTTMAAMLGAFPLMLSQGVGSELRQPLGITMVGGLIVSQVLTLFTVPVIFLWFDRLANKIKNYRVNK